MIVPSHCTYGTQLANLEPPWTLSWRSLRWRPPPPCDSRRYRMRGTGAHSDGPVGVSGSFKLVIVPSCYTYGTPLLTLEPTQVQYCALLITLTLPVGAPAWGCAHAGRARPVCGEFLQLRKKKRWVTSLSTYWTRGTPPQHLPCAC